MLIFRNMIKQMFLLKSAKKNEWCAHKYAPIVTKEWKSIYLHIFSPACVRACVCQMESSLLHGILPMMDPTTDFTKLVFTMLRSLSIDRRLRFLMVTWEIWRRRNDQVRQRKCEFPRILIMSNNYLREWEQAKKEEMSASHQHQPQIVRQWQLATPTIWPHKVQY